MLKERTPLKNIGSNYAPSCQRPTPGSVITSYSIHYTKLYDNLIARLLGLPYLVVPAFILMLVVAAQTFTGEEEIFLPDMDDGRVSASISTDPGVTLAEMDAVVQVIERLFEQQPEVEHVFSLVGGFIFGRTEREA